MAPTRVVELSDVVQIASGTKHDCAVTRANEVRCWGFDNEFQLGNADTRFAPAPVAVTAALVSDDMMFLHDVAVSGGGIALLPTEVALPATRAGQLVVPPTGAAQTSLFLERATTNVLPASLLHKAWSTSAARWGLWSRAGCG